MYKYCNKHFPGAFERMLNKNTLCLSSKQFIEFESPIS